MAILDRNIRTLNDNFIKNIPDDLKIKKNWVLYNYQKMPIQQNGIVAKSNDKNTWGLFDDVLKKYNNDDKYAGIGFVLNKTDFIIGIDIDQCVKDGIVSKDAEEIVNILQSYTEFSPSGNGLHILIKTENLLHLHNEHVEKFKDFFDFKEIEIITSNKYLTITGNIYKYNKIESRENEFLLLFEKLNKDKQTFESKATNKKAGVLLEINEDVKNELNKVKAYYQRLLENSKEIIASFFEKREITKETYTKFKVMFDEVKNSIIFPVSTIYYREYQLDTNEFVFNDKFVDILNKKYLTEKYLSVIFIVNNPLDVILLDNLGYNAIALNNIAVFDEILFKMIKTQDKKIIFLKGTQDENMNILINMFTERQIKKEVFNYNYKSIDNLFSEDKNLLINTLEDYSKTDDLLYLSTTDKEHVFDDDKQAIDFVRSQFEKYLLGKGINIHKNFSCLNPNHLDNNPSMGYKNGFINCFASCGWVITKTKENYSTGNIFDLIGLEYNLTTFNKQKEKAFEIFNVKINKKKIDVYNDKKTSIDIQKFITWVSLNSDVFLANLKYFSSGLKVWTGKFWRTANSDRIKHMISLYFEHNKIYLKKALIEESYTIIKRKVEEAKLPLIENYFKIMSFSFNNGTLYLFPEKVKTKKNDFFIFKENEWNKNDHNLYLLNCDFSEEMLFKTYYKDSIVETYFRDFYSNKEALVIFQFLGAILIPEFNLQKALFILGSGANGKSVFTDAFSQLFNKEAVSSVNVEAWGKTHENIGLSESIFNISAEITEREIGSSSFKLFVTQDNILFNQKYNDPIFIKPLAKHIFICNSLPNMKIGYGECRRMILTESIKSVPKEDQSDLWAKEFFANKDKLLSLAFQGLFYLIKNDYKLHYTSENLLSQLIAENDLLALYVESHLLYAPSNKTALNKIYDVFLQEILAGNKLYLPLKNIGLPKFGKRLVNIYQAFGLDVSLIKEDDITFIKNVKIL